MLSFLRVGIRPTFDGVATGVRSFRSKAQGGRPAKGKGRSKPARPEKTQRQPQRAPKPARKEFGPRSDSFRALSYGRRREVSEDRPARPFASLDVQKPKAPPKQAAPVAPAPAKPASAPKPQRAQKTTSSPSQVKPKLESKEPSQKLLMLFGRKTVLDALQDPTIEFHSIHMLDKLRDAATADQADSGVSNDVETSPITALFEAAQKHHKGLEIQFVSRKELAQISKHQQQDQGVVAQIVAPKDRSVSVANFLKSKHQQYTIVALEGIASETNMGTIVRTTTASPSVDAMLLLEGCCSVQNPIVQFASCGVALKAKFIQSYSPASSPKKPVATGAVTEGPGAISVEALEKFKSDGAAICVLAPAAEESLFDFKPPEKVVYILGAESTGVSEKVKSIATHKLRIPLARSVESLSVASTAAIIAFFHQKK